MDTCCEEGLSLKQITPSVFLSLPSLNRLLRYAYEKGERAATAGPVSGFSLESRW